MKMVGHAEIVCSPDKNTAATFQLFRVGSFFGIAAIKYGTFNMADAKPAHASRAHC